MKNLIKITKDQDLATLSGSHEWEITYAGEIIGSIFRDESPWNGGWEWAASGYRVNIDFQGQAIKKEFVIGDRKAISVIAEAKRFAKSFIIEALEAAEVAPEVAEAAPEYQILHFDGTLGTVCLEFPNVVIWEDGYSENLSSDMIEKYSKLYLSTCIESKANLETAEAHEVALA